MYTKEDFLAIALAEAGYLEKKSATNLDDKTANAGTANYTKYARDLHNAGYYNGNKQAVAWCSVFVDWCHYMAANRDKTLAQKVSCQSGDCGAGCTFSMNYYKAAGQFFVENPQPGDQIYFGTSGNATHTGIVTKVSDGRVHTIEGNTSDQSGIVANGGGVYQKSYALSNSRILGYGRPKWEQAETGFPVMLQNLKKGSSGNQVKTLQILLEGYGCSCGSWGADGQFGAGTAQAVCAYQKKNRLQTDGVAGPQTWKRLLGGT